MPSLPGLSHPKPSNNTRIPSPLSISQQRYSSSTLAPSSSLSSAPLSAPDIYVERSRSRRQEDDGKDDRRLRQISTSEASGSYGKKAGLRSRKSGGGFLLEMGVGYGAESALLNEVSNERDGMRSASDPISTLNNRVANTERGQYPESSSSRQAAHTEIKAPSSIDSLARGQFTRAGSEDPDEAYLDEILSHEDDTADIVSMAVGMSENRRNLYGNKGPPVGMQEVSLAIPGRSLSSGARSGSSRPFLASSISQNVPSESSKRRRSKTPSGFLSPLNSRSRSPPSSAPQQLFPDQQRRYIPQPSPMLLQPQSPSFPFHQQQVRISLPFNQSHSVKINVSQSTLARAAKARQYLELFVQYLNLLHSLPPATELYNQQPQQPLHHYYHNNNSQQSAHHNVVHPLRRYNPLQTIRNRRLRNRLGWGQLDVTPWEDASIVNQWVERSVHPEGPDNDAPPAPNLEADHQFHLLPPPLVSAPDKHKTRPKRPKMDWVVHPGEMFADFYWMNECGGKELMEDRLGSRIFPKVSSSVAGSNIGKRDRDAVGSAPTMGGLSGTMERLHLKSRNPIPDSLRHSPQPQLLASELKVTSHFGRPGAYEDNEKRKDGSEASWRGDYPTKGQSVFLGQEPRKDAKESTKGSIDNADIPSTGNLQHSPDPNLQLEEPALPAGPGITIGIGGGYISSDESAEMDDSDLDNRKRGRDSIDSKRYSSQFEDDGMPVAGHTPLRQNFYESPEHLDAQKQAVSRRRQHHHHYHLYPHFHNRRRRRSRTRKEEKDGEESTDSGSGSSTSESSGEENGEGRRRRRWKVRSRDQKHEDTAGAEIFDDSSSMDEGAEKNRASRHGLRAIPHGIGRRLKRVAKKSEVPEFDRQDSSDDDAQYESATAISNISRTPSPAIPQKQESLRRTSLDSDSKAATYLHAPQPRSSLAPPIVGKVPKDSSPLRGLNKEVHSRSPSPGITAIEQAKERGRERKSKDKDELLDIILKRKMSPTKALFLRRRSGEFSFDEDGLEEAASEKSSTGRRDSKDFNISRRGSKDLENSKGDLKEVERDGLSTPTKEKEKKDKGNKALSTVKKAKERVGHRVERIKHGVGDLVRGKETTMQSVPNSNYASSLGSGGGMSDKEDVTDDEVKEDKTKRSKLSMDLEAMFRHQKRRSKPGHRLQVSVPAIPILDLDIVGPGTATASDASVDGDAELPEDLTWSSRGNVHNRPDGTPKQEVPVLKIMRPSSPLSRRGNTTFLDDRRRFVPGRPKLKRERSRLAEEIARGDSESPAVRKQRHIQGTLGRLKLPPIATVHRSTSQSRLSITAHTRKKDIARAQALLLSTGVLARGMASPVQNTQQSPPPDDSETRPPEPEFIGTLQLTAYHHNLLANQHSTTIRSTAALLKTKLSNLRNVTMEDLRSQIEGIQVEVSSRLTPLVQRTSDTADELNVELSTRYVLEVKRLGDEVNMLARRRKRTGLKWVRRGGYVLLEWVVLGVMWWVWMIVVAVRLVRVLGKGVVRGVRWVLWI